VAAAFKNLDFLAVSDIFPDQTSRMAHVLFAAAAAAEKEGTITTTERRIQPLRPAAPPGDARPDWWILAELARRTARRSGRLGKAVSFDYAGPADVLVEIARAVPF
jgi:predicted molibdopterin-dependent oxidoreductase YjgC